MLAAQESNNTAINGLHRPNTGKHWQTQEYNGVGIMDMWLQFPVVHRFPCGSSKFLTPGCKLGGILLLTSQELPGHQGADACSL